MPARPLTPARRRAMNRRKRMKVAGRGRKERVPRGRTARQHGRPYKHLKRFPRVSHTGLGMVGGFSRGGMMPARNSAQLTVYASDARNIAAADGNITLVQIRPDGIFLPFTTPIDTRKVRGFAQWMGLYQLYRVKKCRVTCSFTFAAGSAAELQDIDNNMLLRVAVRSTGAAPSLTDGLEDLYEQRQDRLIRFALKETNITKIIKSFTIDPWAIVKAGASRFDVDRNTGWADSGANPVYETGAIPSFFIQLFKTQANFGNNVELFVEVRVTYDVDFKLPKKIAESL